MKKVVVVSTATVALLVVFLMAFVRIFPGETYRMAMAAERTRAGLAEKDVTVGGRKIVYLEGGRGEPVLLIHGFSADKDNWIRFARYLTGEYRLIIPDLTGFGESEYRDGDSYSVDAQARRIERLATALGVRKFHVAGNSMGGGISARLAAEFPDRLLSLGLFDSAGVHGAKWSETRRMAGRGDIIFAIKSREDFRRLMRIMFVDPPWAPAPVQDYLADRYIRRTPINMKIYKTLRDKQGNTIYKVEDDLARISARTLILWGDTDRVLDISAAAILKQGIANSSIYIVKNCGHLPMLERPAETARVYREFLAGKR